VPADAAGLRWLARSLGFRDTGTETEAQRYTAAHARYAVEVRRLHEKLFYRPLLSTVARLPEDALRLSPAAACSRLEALGFADPNGALRHLEALATGLSRRALVLRTMLPVMLAWFADGHDPDAGLLAFRSVAEALGSSPWFLALLRDSDVVAERLARLLSASRYVADLLARAPEAVALIARDDTLLPRAPQAIREEMSAIVWRNDDAEYNAAALRGVRRTELLRVACADLLGLIDVEEVGRTLTAVAEATIGAVLELARRSVEQVSGPLRMRMAVIGMGKLGGAEQGYASDADVLFVHDPVDGASDAEASADAHAVAEELRRLLSLPTPDPPLVVDAGLRPEGRQGALSLSLAGYERYYSGRAAVWEAQALLRARPIAGDVELGRRFEELIAPVRWPEALPPEAVREIRRIKARVDTERLPRGVDRHRHTKLGPGALADVEWTAQLLQLQGAARHPQLRTASTLQALAAARAVGALDGDDEQLLADAWRLAARARNAVMLVRGRASDLLPEDARTMAGLARALGYPAGGRGQFAEDYRRTTRRARTVVERVFYA
jgi:glutamate-ammonia-ligase adenylyltransferase